VGTGAFTVSPCTPQNITYKANPHYWQPGEPKIKTVNYPAFTTNDTANTYLATGQAQWGSQFIPSIKKFYLDKSPNYHYWFPPVANVSMFINLKNPILKNPAVRQAMAYAVNRQRAATIGEYGYQPLEPGGIVTLTFSTWLDWQASGFGSNYAYNPAKAIHPDRRRVQEGLTVPWPGRPEAVVQHHQQRRLLRLVAAVNVLQGNPGGGIQLTPKTWRPGLSGGAVYGNYELAYGSETGGPTPYYELLSEVVLATAHRSSSFTVSNWERYSNPSTDALINSYATTTSAATQHSIVNKLQAVMLKEVPVIPITEQVDWFQYDTGSFSGWVTEANPYAQPAAYNYPDWGQQMLHLAPK
jgi:peptide/nickel transport system substrate-binding protein